MVFAAGNITCIFRREILLVFPAVILLVFSAGTISGNVGGNYYWYGRLLVFAGGNYYWYLRAEILSLVRKQLGV